MNMMKTLVANPSTILETRSIRKARKATPLMLGASLVLGVWSSVTSAHAADWPQWGGKNIRNMYSPQRGLPDAFGKIEFKPGSDENGKPMGGSFDVEYVWKLD